jgi:hypothetical protein
MWRVGFAIFWLLKACRIIRPETTPLPESTCRVLARADMIEVLSLADRKSSLPEEQFFGCAVLGRTTVSDPRARQKLIGRLLLANRYNLGDTVCFDGEYGIRASAGGKIVELAICFDCAVVMFQGPDGLGGSGSIGPWPVSLMRAIVKRAGIPLPPLLKS